MDTSHARPRGRVHWPFTGLLCLLALTAVAQEARAHPAPFSYLDLHLDAQRTSGTLVVHDFDAAHEAFLDVNNGGSGVAIGDTLTKAADGIANVDRVITGHTDTLAWQDFVDYAEFNRLFLEHARTSRAAGKTPSKLRPIYGCPRSSAATTSRGAVVRSPT